VVVGFFSRLLAPRAARRAGSSGRASKRAATPKVVKKARQDPSPVENAVYSVERSITTSLRGKTSLKGKKRKTTKTTKEWRHGKCQVKHRSREAAARCRNP
jgi:hypothetical protein